MIRLFRVYIPTSTILLLAFETGAVFSAFSLAAYFLGELGTVDYLNNLGYLNITLVSFSFIIAAYFHDFYSQVQVQSKLLLAQQLSSIAGLTFLVEALISTVVPELYLPLSVILIGNIVSIGAILAGRLVFKRYVVLKIPAQRLLLLGNSRILDDLVAYLDKYPELRIEVIGHVQDPNPSQLEELSRTLRPNSIVAGQPNSLLANELLELQFLGYSIQDGAEVYAKLCNREGLNGLNINRLLSSLEFEPSDRRVFFQSLFDKLISAVCLIVFSPLLLFVALAVRLCFGASVLERQPRSGLNGVPFTQYYFRVDQVSSLRGDAIPGEASSQTRLGQLLVRTGLYALPQFFNVLCGQMSIVGPQPHRYEFVCELTNHVPFYPHRLKVVPGMTGWSQIHMRHSPGPLDSLSELEYDLYYIKYASPMMNIFIIVQTLKNILVWGAR